MIRASLAALTLLAVSGCGQGLTTPTTTTRTLSFVTGVVNPSGEGFHYIAVSTLGTVELTLVSLASSDNAQRTYNVPVRLSLGLHRTETTTGEDGTEVQVASCTDFIGATVSPGLQTQVTSVVHPGDYCAKVSDQNGRLAGPATFVVREVSP